MLYFDVDSEKYVKMFLWYTMKSSFQTCFTFRDVERFITDYNIIYNNNSYLYHCFVIHGKEVDAQLEKHFDIFTRDSGLVYIPNKNIMRQIPEYVKNLDEFDKKILKLTTDNKLSKLSKTEKDALEDLQHSHYAKSDFSRFKHSLTAEKNMDEAHAQ